MVQLLAFIVGKFNPSECVLEVRLNCVGENFLMILNTRQEIANIYSPNDVIRLWWKNQTLAHGALGKGPQCINTQIQQDIVICKYLNQVTCYCQNSATWRVVKLGKQYYCLKDCLNESLSVFFCFSLFLFLDILQLFLTLRVH